MSLLEVQNIVKTYDGVRALDGATLEVIPNRVNLLIGANGSGKTTLVNIISGMVKADGGRIMYRGADVTGLSAHEAFAAGIVRTFQNPRLFESLSVLENLMITSGITDKFRLALSRGSWARDERRTQEKAMRLLDEVGLEAHLDSLAYEISGGQIKLTDLAKTLMCDSHLVLLDEPIAGINPKVAQGIFKKVVAITRSTGSTFLIIEHRLDIALQYADYVFVMDSGRIIAKGGPQEILGSKAVADSYLGL